MPTVAAILREMGKVSRETRRRQLTSEEGARLVTMLVSLRSTLEVGDLETRVEALERKHP